jgi:hypothetical protein
VAASGGRSQFSPVMGYVYESSCRLRFLFWFMRIVYVYKTYYSSGEKISEKIQIDPGSCKKRFIDDIYTYECMIKGLLML